ncbi:MAG: accessory factor UbiK family protein [Lautropia sp.]|nr:accessory factor UbiK family protein [Lautropia sp.]
MEKQQAFFQEFQDKLMTLFRSSPAADLERNLKALMAQTFNRLELVSREEFDVQVALLQSLQERVETLEAKLAAQRDSSADTPDASRNTRTS